MITAFASLALLLAAAPAAPDPYTEQASVTVRYGDLNLQSAAGRAEFDRRLARAVRTVCPSPDIRQFSAMKAANACRAVATADANRKRAAVLASVGGNTIQIGSSGR